MLFFHFWVLAMVAFFILASGYEVYSSLFSCCCLSCGDNKFSIKFAGKMFKPTSSSISSMVGTFWTVNFCIFFVLTQKLKPQEKKFCVRILPWLQFD